VVNQLRAAYVKGGPSVASLARAEVAAREREAAKQEALHQLASKGNDSFPSPSYSSGPASVRVAKQLRVRDQEAGWASIAGVTGIPEYDASQDRHCGYTKTATYKASP